MTRLTLLVAVMLLALAGVAYLLTLGVRGLVALRAAEMAEPQVITWRVTEALHPGEVDAEVWPREPGKGPWYVEPDRPVRLTLPDGETHLLPPPNPHVAQAWQDEQGRLRGLRLILPPVTIREAAAEMERVCRARGVWREGDEKAVRWYTEDQIADRIISNHMRIDGPRDATYPRSVELRRGQSAGDKNWHAIVVVSFYKQLAKLDGVEPEPPFEVPRVAGVRQLDYGGQNEADDVN